MTTVGRGWASRLSPWLWVAALFVLTLPTPLNQLVLGLDSSWRMGLNMAARQHLQWGRDIVFTYGPLGFLGSLDLVYFGHWLAALAANLGSHLLFLAMVMLFLRWTGARPWAYLLLSAILVLPNRVLPSLEFDTILGAWLLLALALESREPWSTRAAAGAGMLLGGISMVKGTSLLLAALLLGLFAVMGVLGRRRRPAAAAVGAALLSFLVLWIGAGQSLQQIPAFLRATIEIAGGYNAAMSLNDEYHVEWAAAQARLGVALVTAPALAGLYAGLRRNWSLCALQALALPILAVTFKVGFIRSGERQFWLFSVAVLVQGLVLVEAGRQARPGAWPSGVLGAASVAICALLVAGLGYNVGATHESPVWPVATLGQRLRAYDDAGVLLLDSRRRQETLVSARDTLRGQDAVWAGFASRARATGARVDLLPWDIDTAYLFDLRWHPAPVFQSYSAYTPYLDQLDASHYLARDRPDLVGYRYDEIDYRYLPFDEPAAFRALLETYQAAAPARQGPAELTPRPPGRLCTGSLGGGRRRLDEWVPVPPATGLLYGRVDVRYSGLGQLASLVYKPVELHVTMRLADGRTTQAYRLVGPVAADGLYLSSFVPDQASLNQLFAGRRGVPIAAVQITGEHPLRELEPAFDLSFYSRAAC